MSRIEFGILLAAIITVVGIYVIYLLIKALNTYINNNKAENKEKRGGESKFAIGDKIKEYRVKCNMTQEYVAESLGVTRQAVSKWECGESVPTKNNILLLSELFEIDSKEIFLDKTGEF